MNEAKTPGSLSDKELTLNLKALSRKESLATAKILFYLAEVEKRKLYLEQGYSSLFSYCTKGFLKYSEPAASRRITSARLLRRFPELYDLLLEREVSLTALSMVSRIITDDNKDELIEKIKGKSKREVEMLISGFKPQKEVRDRIKPIVVTPPEEPVPGPLFGKPGERKDVKEQEVVGSAGGTHSPDRESEVKYPAPEPTRRYELRFSVSEDVMKKYEEVQMLLSGKYPKDMSMENVLDEVLEIFLEKKSPKRREERREKRSQQEENRDKDTLKPKSRYIPQAVRDRVYLRDGGRCTYESPEGLRCDSRHDLEVDHIVPVGKGGSSEIDNLRLLCRSHNGHAAFKEYGEQHMSKFLSKSG